MIKKRVLLVLVAVLWLWPVFDTLHAKERRGVVTMMVDLKAPAEARTVRLWVPYPLSDENQEITRIGVTGNYSSAQVYREGRFGNTMLFVEWNEPSPSRTLTYKFDVTRKERITKDFTTTRELPLSQREIAKFLTLDDYNPSAQQKVKDLAARITKGKSTVLAKAKAVYGWIVENMHRDANVKGCGFGEVDKLVETLGGKCADIHSVFVALARASGVPAREIYGLRMPAGSSGDATKAQHCWAEFYLPGYGWVVADPADVAKAILEKNLTLAQAQPYREYFFGAVDESRIAYGTGRNIVLNPAQANAPLTYFMYPYAEADGKMLNEDLYGFNLGYTITFSEEQATASTPR
jgi:transglutaminase-like putative cysteine protease